MTRKRGRAEACPLCGARAHMAEYVIASRQKTLYAVVCDNQECRLSEIPPMRLCFKDEFEAVAVWNGMVRGA